MHQQSHTRDIVLTALFNRNELLMKKLIDESAPRVAAMGLRANEGVETTAQVVQTLLNLASESIENCTVVFLALLSRDVLLKEKVLKGIPAQLIEPMVAEKAPNFFLYLDRDVLLPWLHDEMRSHADMIQDCKRAYLCA